MEEKKSILYVQTSDAPERQYSPLVFVQTAKVMDIDAKVYYLGKGLKILLPGEAEQLIVLEILLKTKLMARVCGSPST